MKCCRMDGVTMSKYIVPDQISLSFSANRNLGIVEIWPRVVMDDIRLFFVRLRHILS